MSNLRGKLDNHSLSEFLVNVHVGTSRVTVTSIRLGIKLGEASNWPACVKSYQLRYLLNCYYYIQHYCAIYNLSKKMHIYMKGNLFALPQVKS